MPLIHFDVPSIFRCAVNLASLIHEYLPDLEEEEGDFVSSPTCDALTTALTRLLQSLMSRDDEDWLRDLFDAICCREELDLSNPEHCAGMAAHFRLLKHCELADASPEIGQQLVNLAMAIINLKHGDYRGLLAAHGKCLLGLWQTLPVADRQALQVEYVRGLKIWHWPTLPQPQESLSPEVLEPTTPTPKPPTSTAAPLPPNEWKNRAEVMDILRQSDLPASPSTITRLVGVGELIANAEKEISAVSLANFLGKKARKTLCQRGAGAGPETKDERVEEKERSQSHQAPGRPTPEQIREEYLAARKRTDEKFNRKP